METSAYCFSYSTEEIDFTISAFAIERSGIADAVRQAITETIVASKMGTTGIFSNCKALFVAAPIKTEHKYPKTPPTIEAIKP